MPRVLVVEDDKKVASLLCRFLAQQGFEVSTQDLGKSAIEEILKEQPDLVVLDMMLPDMDGIAVCEAVRPRFNKGILMLTAHQDDMNEVMALNAGIDDFMAKPARPHILLARLWRMWQRQADQAKGAADMRAAKAANESVLSLRDLSIDRRSRQVSRSNEIIPLSDAQFELLWCLASRAGEVLSRDTLFKTLKGSEYDGLDRAMDMRIATLRQSLGSSDYIRTVRHLGYVFVKES
ncbi:response regulator [Aliiglaciecola sp. CAU 1673]|uniref:response regulator n=1 Tax=Aliiglaciecola sp. CAU 1673 TaxID=3032595 RepID=UPI0023DC252A|nr:response regulator [Aliiglaciecola sp. CAU 1673]MDF2179936.1 response regulator [Aliiglaciecola sp. CAU 1673]